MTPLFYLGLSLAFLAFPLGFALGVNSTAGEEIKKFNEKKSHLLNGVLR